MTRDPAARRLVFGARAGALGVSTLLAGGASCPTKTDDCRHGNEQRCLWEQGEANRDGDGAGDSGSNGPVDTDTAIASREEATELDQALADMIEIMGAGLEWASAADCCAPYRLICNLLPRTRFHRVWIDLYQQTGMVLPHDAGTRSSRRGSDGVISISGFTRRSAERRSAGAGPLGRLRRPAPAWAAGRRGSAGSAAALERRG